jgi:hypothetical protein
MSHDSEDRVAPLLNRDRNHLIKPRVITDCNILSSRPVIHQNNPWHYFSECGNYMIQYFKGIASPNRYKQLFTR